MREEKQPAGADLVIPLLALAFAGYFFVDIADLAWEAKANGVIVGTVLVILVVAQLVRIGLAVARGRATLGFAPLVEPRDAHGKRFGMVVVTIVFIATIKWLGLTLGLLLGMVAALWIMGVRRWKPLVFISTATAASAYLLFIAALDSNFPHGPIERALSGLF